MRRPRLVPRKTSASTPRLGRVHTTVVPRAERRRNVLIRWRPTATPCDAEGSIATSRASTMKPPMSASTPTMPSAHQLAARAGWPAVNERRQTTTSATPRRTTRPLVTRWDSSMRSATDRAWGMTSPLQSGQWLPQPAPEPVARTKPPQTMTTRLAISTPSAKRAAPPFDFDCG